MQKILFTIGLIFLGINARDFSFASATINLANACAENVQVTLDNGPQGSHILMGSFCVEASSQTVWNVLSDYNHLSQFVSSVKKSHIIQHDETEKILEQVMTGHAGIFHKRIFLTLKLTESLGQKILFHDTSKKSFKKYNGSWAIELNGNKQRVLYQLEAEPAFFAPDFLTNGAFKKSVETLLQEVQAEIVKRHQS